VDFERLYPWLRDPSKEIPTLTPERFAILERHRAQSACRADAPPEWARIFELLTEMRDLAASRSVPLASCSSPTSSRSRTRSGRP
jgi:hypothetical protein